MLSTIEKIEPLSNHIFRVFFKPGRELNYKAGQHLNVSLSFGSLPFSIASPPSENKLVELHIGGTEAIERDNVVIDELNHAWLRGKKVVLSEAQGDAWLRNQNENPLLLIASDTGISYILSILKYSLIQGFTQPIYVYWGAKGMKDLYVHEELIDIVLEHKNVSYVPIIETSTTPQYAKQGKVLDIVMSDFGNLSEFDIYLCGPNHMIEMARKWLCRERGAEPEHVYADEFAYL
ncbi:NAD(P)H-flavin reductase [Vibrio sagamiensis]|uniref:NAD(P)H-flavin reductase n=1 Tax=Vibrio sagamiensis NBRC 104589 TaxID=1219064 RepID=A0A511QJ24_9VIBR|nr:NAD(P)H-flavin reductase [Vibrio sagamiensis]PNQ56224.1 NAD(P)H-flavin reductase [Vibrio agarivorans]GEM77313.1 NAD(P)H-flavin reductase [Vibrio sagamiensis NBRC 104589]